MSGTGTGRVAYLDDPVIALAHRGGAAWGDNAGIENTLAAFAKAVDAGVTYLETDVRATRDGVAVVVHDADLTRLAGRRDRVADLDLADLRAVRVGGREPVPTLAELLAAFPHVRLNVDVKSDDAVRPTIDAVRAAGAEDRVLLASFGDRRLRRIRRLAPRIATSASSWEVALLLLAPVRALWATAARRGACCVQVPRRTRGVDVLVPRLVRRAHALGLQVHVWTLDDEPAITAALDLGVDGIVSDRPDVLLRVLGARGSA